MRARFIDWIWHVRGTLALAPQQSGEEAFDRLEPLFGESGTSHQRSGDTLTFSKKDQAAQDKMSVFDGGVLQIEQGGTGSVLRYNLTSRALLFCFLAPLLFLAFGQLTVALGKLESSAAEAGKEAGDKKDDKKDDKKPAAAMNPIDKFLGAPEPEKPDAKKDKEKGADKKHSPTSAYVFAAFFAALYVIGRILEDRLVRKLFRRKLLGV